MEASKTGVFESYIYLHRPSATFIMPPYEERQAHKNRYYISHKRNILHNGFPTHHSIFLSSLQVIGMLATDLSGRTGKEKKRYSPL